MKQYTFSSTEDFIEGKLDKIAEREMRSRSEMIDILLRRAVKERTRKTVKRNEQSYFQDKPTNPR